jgi:hypothetical protein
MIADGSLLLPLREDQPQTKNGKNFNFSQRPAEAQFRTGG